MAGLTVIPAIVRDLTNLQVLQHALIENIQRQDLNPLEEALALDKLITDHEMTQESLAKVVGRSRPAIANTLRLLNLPESIRHHLMNEELTAGHARALLALHEEDIQVKAANLIIGKSLNVRETEKLVKKLQQPARQVKTIDEVYQLSVREVERELTSNLGTKVRLKDRNGKGSIVIDYFSNDDLNRILSLIKS
jgi:ParB family chromosome partitioning protein